MTWQIPYVLIAGTRKYALKYADKIYLESSFLRHISRCLLAGYSGRCIRPVLLDPLDLHHPQGPLPARGQGRGPPGCHDKVGYIFTSLIFLNKIFSALTTRRTKGDMWHTTSGWASHFSFRWDSSPNPLRSLQISLYSTNPTLALILQDSVDNTAQSFNKQGDTFVSVLLRAVSQLWLF